MKLSTLIPCLLVSFTLAACARTHWRGPASVSVTAPGICQPASVPALTSASQAEKNYNELLHGNPSKMDAVVFPEARRKALEALFTQAKDEILRYLAARAAAAPSPQWAEMSAAVQAVGLRLSVRPGEGSPPEYGARLMPGNPSTVLLPGVALVYDNAPASIHFIFLHEISHSIDPSRYAVPLSGPSSSVWTQPVRCLRGPDSVRARVGDPACYRSTQARMATKMPAIARACGAEADALTSNPDFAATGPGCNCDSPWGAEAFADWLATEVMSGLDGFSVPDALAWPCATFLSQAERDAALLQSPSGAQVLASIHSMDVHPPMKDRIERILLANPRVAAKLGLEPAAAAYCAP